MKLSHIFDSLRTGELRLLSIGGGEQGEIRPEDYPTMITHINLALAAIFGRFTLKEEKLTLLLEPGVTRYELSRTRAVSNTGSTATPKYIEDTDRPFQDDLAKVLAIHTDEGEELALNNRADKWSCHTPSTYVLEVPEKIVEQAPDVPAQLKTGSLVITYRATHPWLPVDLAPDFNPAQVEVDLPVAYLQALLYYVASRAHHPVSLNSEVSQTASYAVKYETECMRLESNNLHLNKEEGTDKFHARGWV